MRCLVMKGRTYGRPSCSRACTHTHSRPEGRSARAQPGQGGERKHTRRNGKRREEEAHSHLSDAVVAWREPGRHHVPHLLPLEQLEARRDDLELLARVGEQSAQHGVADQVEPLGLEHVERARDEVGLEREARQQAVVLADALRSPPRSAAKHRREVESPAGDCWRNVGRAARVPGGARSHLENGGVLDRRDRVDELVLAAVVAPAAAAAPAPHRRNSSLPCELNWKGGAADEAVSPVLT